ncbi:MAG: hypothetical protein RI907_992 [Pseudomonadota bacterium]|jgi:hypothetical protein
MARMGINPESGAHQAVMDAGDIGAAKVAAGAAYQARKNVELQGYARKMDAANLGRNLASNQATSAGVAVNAANASAGNAATPVAIGNQATAGVSAGIGQAIGGNASAGSLYSQAGSLDLSKRGQDMKFVTDAAEAAAGIYGAAQSDENVKDNTGKVMSPAKALGAILKTPVDEGWEYSPEKGGPDDGRQPHDGPMAQDVQKNMGESVAPGGKVIDLVSMNGILMAGIQGLHKEVQDLAKKVEPKKASRKSASMAAQGVM